MRRLLHRYEYRSLWETQEIRDELYRMWDLAQRENRQAGVDEEAGKCPTPSADDPDKGKPRVTVRQYAALISQEVAANLEGLARARREKHPRAEFLAQSARVGSMGDDIKAIAQNRHTPQLVREALNMMQMATSHVIGTDGHRRLCRHEGNAYTILFGPPLEFCTPNLADGKQCLLLVVQNEEISLDASLDTDQVLPKYRDMLLRLAKDPVGQTLVFHLIMRLFFQHVLGVRPESIESRRGGKSVEQRDWCTDGLATSTCPGIFGPIAAFRGEIEAQGRGSLHPHILVWLVVLSISQVVEILHRDRDKFQQNLYQWMRASVAAVESICQSSVRALPRRFGDLEHQVQPLGFNTTERRLCMYDGGSELGLLEAIPEEQRSDAQKNVLASDEAENWCRPCFPLRDVAGCELTEDTEVGGKRESVYSKPISNFAVGQCPNYRRLHTISATMAQSDVAKPSADQLPDVPSRHDDRDQWTESFYADVRALAQEIFVHICGDSCHKYSGKKKEKICRHGFYYIVNLSDWEKRHDGVCFRRQGKALRNAMFVVKETKHGMQGKHPHPTWLKHRVPEVSGGCFV